MNRWQRFKYELRLFRLFLTISCLTEKERKQAIAKVRVSCENVLHGI